jgi:uncharacterized ferritin-like protein (DUF455 family)
MPSEQIAMKANSGIILMLTAIAAIEINLIEIKK